MAQQTQHTPRGLASAALALSLVFPASQSLAQNPDSFSALSPLSARAAQGSGGQGKPVRQSAQLAAHAGAANDDSGRRQFLLQLLGGNTPGPNPDPGGSLPGVTTDAMTTATGLLTTGLISALSLKLADAVYGHFHGGESLHFGPDANDSRLRHVARQFMTRSLYLSVFQGIEGAQQAWRQILQADSSSVTPAVAEIAAVTGRVTLSQALRDLSARAVVSDKKDWHATVNFAQDISSQGFLLDILASLNRGGLDLSLKAAEPARQDERRQIVSQAAALLESSLLLSLVGHHLAMPPGAEDAHDSRSSSLRPAIISLFHHLKDLVATVVMRASGDTGASGQFLVAGILAASSLPLHYYYGLTPGRPQGDYGPLFTVLTTESSGAKAGFGLTRLYNSAGSEKSPGILFDAAVRTGIAMGAALTLQAASFLTEKATGSTLLPPIIATVSNGLVAAGVVECLQGVREGLVEPWIVRPLLARARQLAREIQQEQGSKNFSPGGDPTAVPEIASALSFGMAR